MIATEICLYDQVKDNTYDCQKYNITAFILVNSLPNNFHNFR